MIRGRGKFAKRRVVEGDLEISSCATDDERLRWWMSESRTVLPRLRAIVSNGYREPAPLPVLVDDLRRRVEELEQDLARLRGARADA